MDDVTLQELWEKCKEQSKYGETRAAVEEFNKNNRYSPSSLCAWCVVMCGRAYISSSHGATVIAFSNLLGIVYEPNERH